MSSIRVVVYTAEERGRRILADELDEEMATAGVLVDEIGDIMDEPGDDDQRTLDSLVLDCNRESTVRC